MRVTGFLGFVPKCAIVIEPTEFIEGMVDPCGIRHAVLRDERGAAQIDADEPAVLMVDRVDQDTESAAVTAPSNPGGQSIRLVVDHVYAAHLLLGGSCDRRGGRGRRMRLG